MPPAIAPAVQALQQRIKTRRARVGVIGLGHVGLPLAVEFAKAGFSVTGIDMQEARIARLNHGQSYVRDVASEVLRSLVEGNRLRATTDFAAVKDLDAVNIAVSMPLRKTKDPDTSHVVSVCRKIATYLRRGQLVILESTAYPGTTDESVLSVLEESGLKVGEDFFLCFSPERVNRSTVQTKDFPKVVGGATRMCTQMGSLFYSQAWDKVVPVSSTKVAEMVGVVNQFAHMCDRTGLDIREVIDAATIQPFDFAPFYPEPGLGGHLIPNAPFHLSGQTKQVGFSERAGYLATQRPQLVVDMIQEALNDVCKPLRGSHVHVLGVAIKPDIDEVRNSPAVDTILLLDRKGALITYSDPYVPTVRFGRRQLSSSDSLAMAEAADCVVVVTDHAQFDYPAILEKAKLIVDTRNVFKNHSSEKIVRLWGVAGPHSTA
jgi:UDP-N-acetyl-D-glucosamine dehydrogenase